MSWRLAPMGCRGMALLPTGIYRHIPNMKVTARLPGRDHTSGTAFRIMREPFPPTRLAAVSAYRDKDGPENSGWFVPTTGPRKANLEGNRQLRVLFRGGLRWRQSELSKR